MASPQLDLDLPPAVDAPRLARSAVRARLSSALPDDTLLDLQIAVGELVTHAVMTGSGTIALRARIAGDVVQVEVADQGGTAAGALRTAPRDYLPVRLLERLAVRTEIHEHTISVTLPILG